MQCQLRMLHCLPFALAAPCHTLSWETASVTELTVWSFVSAALKRRVSKSWTFEALSMDLSKSFVCGLGRQRSIVLLCFFFNDTLD